MKYLIALILIFTQYTFAASQIQVGDFTLNIADAQVKCDAPVQLSLDKSIVDHASPCTQKLKVLPPQGKTSIPLKLDSKQSALGIVSQLSYAEFKPQLLEARIGSTLLNWNFLDLQTNGIFFKCSKAAKKFLTIPAREILRECLKLSNILVEPVQIKTDAVSGSAAAIQVAVTDSQVVGSTQEITIDTGDKNTQLKNVSFSAAINVDALQPKVPTNPPAEPLYNMQVFIEKLHDSQGLETNAIIDVDRVFNAKINLVGNQIFLRAKYDFVLKHDIAANMRYELQESPRALLVHVEKGTFKGISLTSIMMVLIKRLVADKYLKVKDDTITILY